MVYTLSFGVTEKMRIGSRPSSRGSKTGIESLRAIPWVFAWSQNRHMITNWYGVGSAIQSFLDVRGDKGARLLGDMFNESRLMRLIVDEVEKALARVDLRIARDYASLVSDERVREEIFSMIGITLSSS